MAYFLKRSMAVLIGVIMICSSITALAAPDKSVSAKVKEIQKYGNVVMDVEPKALYDAGFEPGDVLEVTIGGKKYNIPFCTSYSDVDTGKLLVRHDKTNNLLIVAINMGNISKDYSLKVGDGITFAMFKKGAYLGEYLARQLTRTNVRSDYATDSVFANFRNISTKGIKPGVLYRSASPINNEIGRAQYADALARAVGIKTVLNLADSKEEVEGYIKAKDFKSTYYQSLIKKNRVNFANMTVDVAGEEFSGKLADTLRFMIKNPAPYLVHCTEGKDRAGFTAAVLEALMGASINEIGKDYMLSFENYYKVEKNSAQYNKIKDSNIVNSITTVVCGLEDGSSLKDVDLQKATESYLKKIGLTEKEIASLKAKLAGESVFKQPNIRGKVESVEKYGHASTNILITDFDKQGFKIGDMVAVVFDNGFVVNAPYLDGYMVETGYPLVRAYPGHTNIAVCINYGKLNEIADLKVGDGFTIMLSKKAGYLPEYNVRKLERTNVRSDYASDEIFANFRNITAGKIAKGVLYRTSSPVNNELGRAAYADRLIKAAGVKTVVNLADSDENIKSYMEAADFKSPYYADLYKNKHVVPLSLSVAYRNNDFRAGIVKGVKFIAEQPGPYAFHCTEGKDRAGFMAVLLESLMGASKTEIVDDYMISYYNYFNVKKGSRNYSIIKRDVLKMMEYIAGTSDLSVKNLKDGAFKYLMDGGMTIDEINRVKTNLSSKISAADVRIIDIAA